MDNRTSRAPPFGLLNGELRTTDVFAADTVVKAIPGLTKRDDYTGVINSILLEC